MTFSSNYREVRKIGIQLYSFHKEQPNRPEFPYPHSKKKKKLQSFDDLGKTLSCWFT